MLTHHSKDRSSLCTFTFADGRRCRTPRQSGRQPFCCFHARKQAQLDAADQLGRDFTYLLSGDYFSACDLAAALGRLFASVARGDVKPRAAATLAYLAQTLLQTIQAARHEYTQAFGHDAWRHTIYTHVKQNQKYLSPAPAQPVAQSAPQPETAAEANPQPASQPGPPPTPQPAPQLTNNVPKSTKQSASTVVPSAVEAGLQPGSSSAFATDSAPPPQPVSSKPSESAPPSAALKPSAVTPAPPRKPRLAGTRQKIMKTTSTTTGQEQSGNVATGPSGLPVLAPLSIPGSQKPSGSEPA